MDPLALFLKGQCNRLLSPASPSTTQTPVVGVWRPLKGPRLKRRVVNTKTNFTLNSLISLTLSVFVLDVSLLTDAVPSPPPPANGVSKACSNFTTIARAPPRQSSVKPQTGLIKIVT